MDTTTMHTTRRELLGFMAGAATLATAGAGAARRAFAPSVAHAGEPLEADRRWLTLLATSLTDELDYEPRVEGRLPSSLRGTLYRNGPGLFERGGHRKQHILDGDGMVQAFRFEGGRLRYRNRFVRTEKYVEEERAGRYRNPTWTTLAPSWLDNLPGFPRKSQAGVTVAFHDGRLLAIDEAGLPYALDPATLETAGPFRVVDEERLPGSIKAHTKTDARNGDWIVLGWSTGASTWLDVIVRGADGRLKSQRRVKAADGGYVHDFFATERYVVVSMQALTLSPLPLLAGMKSVTESLEWRPERGNLLMVIDKNGDAEPVVVEAPASFMWHALNAYERGGEIVADFIGYDEPDHFIGDDPLFAAIMNGRSGNARHPGTVRRYVIDPAAGRVNEETIVDGNFEFPMVNPAHACRPYRLGYACIGEAGTLFHDGIARIDTSTGATEQFRFGDGYQVGEPVFVPEPGASYTADAAGEHGWLLALALDGSTRKSFLAVFDARAIAAGPVARVLLDHHTPYSFHGCWRGVGKARSLRT